MAVEGCRAGMRRACAAPMRRGPAGAWPAHRQAARRSRAMQRLAHWGRVRCAQCGCGSAWCEAVACARERTPSAGSIVSIRKQRRGRACCPAAPAVAAPAADLRSSAPLQTSGGGRARSRRRLMANVGLRSAQGPVRPPPWLPRLHWSSVTTPKHTTGSVEVSLQTPFLILYLTPSTTHQPRPHPTPTSHLLPVLSPPPKHFKARLPAPTSTPSLWYRWR